MPVASVETAASGDPASWRTDEFKADWGLGAIGADYAYARGLSGQGVRLGLLDSGVGFEHSEFAGKHHHGIQIGDLLADGTRCTNTSIMTGPGACFSSKGDAVQIDYLYFDSSVPQPIRDIILNGPFAKPGFSYGSHGTHVAGTIAANRDGIGMHGVSLGVDLTSAKLFFDSISKWTRTATGYGVISVGGVGADTSAFAEMYAQMNADGVRAVNHSWGFARDPDTEELLDLFLSHPALQDLWNELRQGSLEKGMIQVWAAGNTAGAIARPDRSPIAGVHATLPRKFSELEPYWLSVVNVRPDGNPDNPGFVLSNRSMKCGFSMNWCVAAPGTLITSSIYGNDEASTGGIVTQPDGSIALQITGHNPTFDYTDLSGTSMATPHVTGALGLLFERFPYLSNAQVRDVLLTTPRDMGAPGIDEIYGWGMIDLKKAIDGPGLLRVDTDVVMDQRAGGTKVWQGDAWTIGPTISAVLAA